MLNYHAADQMTTIVMNQVLVFDETTTEICFDFIEVCFDPICVFEQQCFINQYILCSLY